MDTTPAVTHVSLCAGYGGIDLGLKRAVPALRTVAFSEIEAFAVANLVAKMEAGHLDPAPVWTNLKTFPWEWFRGCVDILSGGYPCQPFSSAGKRLGEADPRHLWPHIADGIARMQPGLCFFENVEGHITLGLRNVLHDLGGMGYRTTWGVFSAAEVGAPHQRKRVFILAHRDDSRGGQDFKSSQLRADWLEQSSSNSRRDHETSANQRSSGAAEAMADAGSAGSQGHRGERGHGEGRVQVQVGGRGGDVWPSRPGEPQHGWEPARAIPRTQSELGGRTYGTANRVDRLRLAGNGVVPATAERAFRTLIKRLL